MKLTSIIIPVYNSVHYVEKSIKSIIQQNYKNLEILICDDASTDNSFTLLKKLEEQDHRIKLFRNSQNLGYLKTTNFLAQKASGEYIAFQDADDISHKDRIKEQVDFLNKNENIALVGTNYSIIDLNDKVILKSSVISHPNDIKNTLKKKNPFQKPSIMFRSEIRTTVGMFREGFLKLGNISEDFDWILRISEQYLLSNINRRDSLYLYRSVPTAMTKSYENVEQLFGHDIALFLAVEREKFGKDSLEKGDFDILHNLIEKMTVPYLANKSLFYHIKASDLIYSGLHKQAIKIAYNSIKKEPFKISNYRLLQYCIRKYILKR